MTHYSLTPEVRTQLSALLDNELPEAERESTIRLLAGSEEARRYLQHLRSLRTLTVDNHSGTTKRIVAASSPALTGAAIRTAATNSGGLLGGAGSLLNSWMLAAAAGAAILGGVFLTQLSSESRGPQPQASVKVAPQPSTTPVAKAIAVDTASLIIPPLTRNDLLAFAVEGTLPIEAQRRCYLTISPAKGDSVKLTVHAQPPKTLTEADIKTPAIAASLAVLDSLADVVRTTVVRTPNGIALRQDAPRIRAMAVGCIERTPHLPERLRARVELVQRELAVVEHVRPIEPADFDASFNTYIEIEGTDSDVLIASHEGVEPRNGTFSLVINGAESHISIRSSSIRSDNRSSLAVIGVSSNEENIPAEQPVAAARPTTRTRRTTVNFSTSAQRSDSMQQSSNNRPRSVQVQATDIDTGGIRSSINGHNSYSINLGPFSFDSYYNSDEEWKEELRRAMQQVKEQMRWLKEDEDILVPRPPAVPLFEPAIPALPNQPEKDKE